MQEKTRKKLPPAELDDILGDHRRWLESEGSHGRRADLRCCDLSNRDLFGVVLKMAVLKDIDFSHANLRTADLKQADIHNCRFHKAHMQWSILKGAGLHNSDLTQANLQFCDFSDTTMSDADFAGAFFHNAYHGNAELRNVNLAGTNLRFSTWSSSELFQIKFTASTIQQADFSYASLREIDFRKARIFNTDFTGSDLNEVDFSAARLENVNFQGTDLDPIYLQEMEEIWIIGLGQFGCIAFQRLSETLKDGHFVLVDPVEENILKCKGPAATLRISDGVKFLERHLKKGRKPDWIIPALPLHLAAEWILLYLGPKRLRRIPLPSEIETLVPNPIRGSEGNIYVSHADFKCPADCEEPREIGRASCRERV